jgi:hypothetical protein
MRITAQQLRKIITEEVKKSVLEEAQNIVEAPMVANDDLVLLLSSLDELKSTVVLDKLIRYATEAKMTSEDTKSSYTVAKVIRRLLRNR